MKNRAIVWILLISILLTNVFVSPVYAAESDSYMVPSYGIYQNFMELSYPDAFNNRLYLATLDACSNLDNLIDKASWIIGEDLTVERCTEILANMATLMNYQLEDAIVEQASVDTTKTLLDYGIDLASIAAGAMGSEALKKGSDAVVKRITTAIGITNGALDFTANTIEDLELLIQLESDYSMQYDFLETVYMYADIPEMKEAAQSLILANKEIMRYKLETITSVGESFAKFESTDVFLDQVAGELLEDPDFWGSDAYGPLMVLSAVSSKFSLFKLTLDIGLFLGDSLFGTSDIYNRYNEMIALRDIHNALLARVKANPALNEEDYENMDRNISLMKMALYVDARGEYCAYQLTTEGKLSELFSSANEENIENNYNTSIDIIKNTFASLDGLYVEEEWGINTPVNSKQLTQVNCIRDGICYFQVNLTYNEDGLLAAYTSDCHSDYENKHSEYQYAYNENGQLVQRQRLGNQHPERRNYYADDGTLTSWSHWDGDREYKWICEYDSHGRLIKEYTLDGNYSTVYSYNDEGLVSYKKDNTMYRTGENTYLYDSSGRLVEETDTSEGAFGSDTFTLKYRYDYYPFTLVDTFYDNTGSFWSSNLRYEDIPILDYFLDVDDTTVFEMEDGYLTRADNKDCTYEFSYDNIEWSDSVSVNNCREAYIQIINQALKESEANITSYSRGLLYDIDEDGFDELFIYYYCDDDPSTWWYNVVCSIFDFRNGTLVPIAEKNIITWDGAAGINHYAGIVAYQGDPKIMTFYSTGRTSGARETTYYYKFYNGYDFSLEHEFDFESANYKFFNFQIDGNTVTRNEFLAELSKIEGLEFQEVDYGEKINYVDLTMPLEELLAQLKEH